MIYLYKTFSSIGCCAIFKHSSNNKIKQLGIRFVQESARNGASVNHETSLRTRVLTAGAYLGLAIVHGHRLEYRESQKKGTLEDAYLRRIEDYLF